MANPTKIDLGAFAAGEIPPMLVMLYTDFDDIPIDLTGYITTGMNVEAIPNPPGPVGDGVIAAYGPLVEGKISYTWSATDMETPGDYEAQLWVSNGINKYASDLILYTVYDGPGEAP